MKPPSTQGYSQTDQDSYFIYRSSWGVYNQNVTQKNQCQTQVISFWRWIYWKEMSCIKFSHLTVNEWNHQEANQSRRMSMYIYAAAMLLQRSEACFVHNNSTCMMITKILSMQGKDHYRNIWSKNTAAKKQHIHNT